jgi:hypothetical protein
LLSVQTPEQHSALPTHAPAVAVQHFALTQLRPVGQSAPVWQPQLAPLMHAWPFELSTQTAHGPPLLPQAALVSPTTQALFEQQPLHCCPPPQAAPHWCELRSQAVPAGQSSRALQPQA